MTDRNTVSSDDLARTKHFLSVYTDEEREWLVKTDKEERNRGRRFMEVSKKIGTQNTPIITICQHKTSEIMQRDSEWRRTDPTQLMKSNKKWWTKTARQNNANAAKTNNE